MIREAIESDLEQLLQLYGQLHNSKVAVMKDEMDCLWKKIMRDQDHHIIVAIEDQRVVASCVCVIIPNLTHNQQPYAFIENVITDVAYRNRGLATECLEYAKNIALKENCYKLMLLTGSKEQATLDFYRNAGYNSEDKTAFIQWI